MMTRIEMAFHQDGPLGRPFQISERQLLGVYRPKSGGGGGGGGGEDVDRAVREALDRPVDAPPLEKAAHDASDVLLLVDDATRTTPTARMLDAIEERLARAGVPDERIRILVAQGTHRPMHRDELVQKIGAERLDRWTVLQHDHQDARVLVDLGTTDDGMPVVVHRAVVESDLVIGLGSVGVHGIMGYSGGAKIALIGAGGEAVEAWTHWRAATRYQTEELLGVIDNPLRRNLNEAAGRVGLDAVLNAVTDDTGAVHAVAYGDPRAAQERLIPRVQDRYSVQLDERVDLVVVEARPADRDYWQSAKGLYTASVAAKDGGAIVLVAANPEGIARNHPNVADLAGLPYSEIVAQVDAGVVTDRIGAAVAAITARTRRRMRLFMVSPGIPDNEVRGLGFEPASSVADAIEAARPALPRDHTVAVLEEGGHMLPVIPQVNRHQVAIPQTLRTL